MGRSVWAAGLLVAGLPLAVQAQSLAPADEALVKAAERSVGWALDHQDLLWPHRPFRDVPWLYHCNGRAFLFNYPGPPPAGFAPLKGHPGVAVALATRDYPRWVRHNQPLGDRRGVLVEWCDPGDGLEPLQAAFHQYQWNHPWKLGPGYRFTLREPESAEELRWAGAEQRLLAEALRAKPRADAALVARFCALREARRQRLGADEARHEDGLEFVEGTAHYVVLKARTLQLAQAGHAHPESVLEELADELEAPLDVKTYALRRYLLTGAAQAFLLERKGLPWKERVEAGQPLFAQTKAAHRYDPADQARWLAEIRKAQSLP